jgi:hypothetical protein
MNVCRMHGGATPKGEASPHFKHGLYSRWAPKQLAEKIEAMRERADLLHDLAEVLPVQHALLSTALEQGDYAAALVVSEAISRNTERWHRQRGSEPPVRSPQEIDERIGVLLGKLAENPVFREKCQKILKAAGSATR